MISVRSLGQLSSAWVILPPGDSWRGLQAVLYPPRGPGCCRWHLVGRGQALDTLCPFTPGRQLAPLVRRTEVETACLRDTEATRYCGHSDEGAYSGVVCVDFGFSPTPSPLLQREGPGLFWSSLQTTLKVIKSHVSGWQALSKAVPICDRRPSPVRPTDSMLRSSRKSRNSR